MLVDFVVVCNLLGQDLYVGFILEFMLLIYLLVDIYLLSFYCNGEYLIMEKLIKNQCGFVSYLFFLVKYIILMLLLGYRINIFSFFLMGLLF